MIRAIHGTDRLVSPHCKMESMSTHQAETSTSIVQDILTETITQGEQAFGFIRMAACFTALVQVWFLFGLSWLDDERLDVLTVVLGIALVGSWWLKKQIHADGPTPRHLATSLALDRFGIFGAMLCLVLWPGEAYTGLGRIPELGFVFLVTIAAGLRLSSRLAISASVFDAAALLLLLHVDSRLNAVRIDTTTANQLMLVIITCLSGGLAWIISKRSARLVWRGANEAKEAEKTKQRLGAYVSTELLDHVLREGNEQLSGKRQDVVVLFSDLRGFTEYSESRDPESLVVELNRYFDAMLEPIQAHGGVVDKFMGDAIMAVWGVLEVRSDDSLRALQAAQAMNEALKVHNADRAAQGLTPLEQGIGLHLGEAVAGDIGTPTRRQYTVVGDPVNIASRLEAMTKELKTPLIVSKSVVETAKRSGGRMPSVEPRGTVTVRGRTQPVEIFSVGPTGDANPQG